MATVAVCEHVLVHVPALQVTSLSRANWVEVKGRCTSCPGRSSKRSVRHFVIPRNSRILQTSIVGGHGVWSRWMYEKRCQVSVAFR